MKKFALLVVLLFAVVFNLTAQDKFPDLQAYLDARGELTEAQDQKNYEAGKSLRETNPNWPEMIRALGGKEDRLDTPLERIFNVYYALQAAEAYPARESILPHSNPKLVDRQLGAYVYKDLVVYRFLNDTQAVNRHEAVLKFITDRNNVTRAEIETFYRNNIRGLISGIVDEEFGKISFLLDTGRAISYNATLMRNPQNGRFTLTYERPSVANDDKELSTSTLDALLTEMRRNTDDFTQTCIDTVRTQAALIPAVRLSKQQLDDIIIAITNFYSSPSDRTFALLKEWYTLIDRTRNTGDSVFMGINRSYLTALGQLNDDLATKVVYDPSPSTYTYITTDQQQKLRQLSNVRGR